MRINQNQNREQKREYSEAREMQYALEYDILEYLYQSR